MKCKHCKKTLAITKPLPATGDAVACTYCNGINPVEEIAWTDGKFRFRVLGDVPLMKVAPRILMHTQSAKTLDIRSIREKAIDIVNRTPNIKCICQEFMINPEDIRVEIVPEIPEE